jgi:hypothetical protein
MRKVYATAMVAGLEGLLYYVADHSNVQLQAMSSIVAAALERHKLPLVANLNEKLA